MFFFKLMFKVYDRLCAKISDQNEAQVQVISWGRAKLHPFPHISLQLTTRIMFYGPFAMTTRMVLLPAYTYKIRVTCLLVPILTIFSVTLGKN